MSEIVGYLFTDERNKDKVYWSLHNFPVPLLPNDIIECTLLTHAEDVNDPPVRRWVQGRVLTRTLRENRGQWTCMMKILVFDDYDAPHLTDRAATEAARAGDGR